MLVIRQGKKEIAVDQLDRLIERFRHFKAEEDQWLAIEDVFVTTPAFAELARRQTTRLNTVLLGRKGDGKTATLIKLTHDIRNPPADADGVTRRPEYVCHIDMQETFFPQMLATFAAVATRIQEHSPNIPAEQVARKLWHKILVLTSLEFVISSVTLDEAQQLDAATAAGLADLNEQVVAELGARARPGTSDRSQNWLAFLEKQWHRIRLLPEDDGLVRDLDGAGHVNPRDILRDLDQAVIQGACLIRDLGILATVTLDRFDDFVDRFVSDSVELTRDLRREFMHGLILALASLEREKAFDWLRVIASLPEDLVIDLNVRELANHSQLLFVRICWSRDNLTAFLDHRVASVIPQTRWSDLFPHQILNPHPNVQSKEPCSVYLIRNTTRKPRELMAHALALLETIRDAKRPLPSRSVPPIVAATNQKIVKDHVIKEWLSSICLLEAFIDRLALREPSTVFTFAEFSGWSSKMPQLVQYSESDEEVPEESRAMLTLSVLFAIGMVGFRVARGEQREGWMRQGGEFVRYVFSYSERPDPIAHIISLLNDPDLRRRVADNDFISIRHALMEGRIERLMLSLCFAPMFVEKANCTHATSYLIDEQTR